MIQTADEVVKNDHERTLSGQTRFAGSLRPFLLSSKFDAWSKLRKRFRSFRCFFTPSFSRLELFTFQPGPFLLAPCIR